MVFVATVVATLLLAGAAATPVGAAELQGGAIGNFIENMVRRADAAITERLENPRLKPPKFKGSSQIAQGYFNRGRDATAAQQVIEDAQLRGLVSIQQDKQRMIYEVACDMAWGRMSQEEQNAVNSLIAQGNVVRAQPSTIPQQNGERLDNAIIQYEKPIANSYHLAWGESEWQQYAADVLRAGEAEMDGGHPEQLDQPIVFADGTTDTYALFYYTGACLKWRS